MSAINIPNATYVHRLYSDGSGDLLAAFQYSGDAKDFAERQLASDADRGFLEAQYVSFHAYDGALQVFRHKLAKAAA